jgi:hypothetical protein
MWNRARTFKTGTCRSSASAAFLKSEYMRRHYATFSCGGRCPHRHRMAVASTRFARPFGAPPPEGEPGILNFQAAVMDCGLTTALRAE